MADKDAQLELKKRARRRLVGAVALALLAVIVLPMVMDDEPRTGSQDIQVRIPSRDGSQKIAGEPETGARPGGADRSPTAEAARPVPEPAAADKPAAVREPSASSVERRRLRKAQAGPPRARRRKSHRLRIPTGTRPRPPKTRPVQLRRRATGRGRRRC